MLYVFLAMLILIIDQVSKYLVRANIPLGGHVPFIPHVLELTYVKNTGAAFSMLAEHTWVLSALSAVIVVVMLIALKKRFVTHPMGVLPVVLVIAGGIGNLIDRILLGYVTDMFATLFMDFAVFNVADIAITVGAFWLAGYVLLFYDKLEAKEAPGNVDGTDLPADDS